MINEAAVLALVKPISARMAHLLVGDRITLLAALLAQEICTYPAPHRAHMLAAVIQEMPQILRDTEAGMRDALSENARNGL